MLYRELDKCHLEHTILSIEREDITGSELTGTVEFLNSEVVLMAQYTNEGGYDGLTFFPLEQITEIYWGNRFHESIAKLVRKNRRRADKLPPFYLESFPQGVIELGQIYGHLAIFSENFSETGFDIGQIMDSDHEWIKIQGVGNMSSLSTVSKLIKLENVTRVEVDTPYLNNLLFLQKEKSAGGA